MSRRGIARPGGGATLRWAAALGVVALSLGAILTLASEVRTRLDELEVAYADNIDWMMMQAEVELQALHIALYDAQESPAAPLEQVRRKFDVLYSRIDIIRNGDAYERVRDIPSFNVELATVRDFLDRTAPIIDAPDEALRGRLPRLEAEAHALSPSVRRMGLDGNRAEARRSAALRERITETLTTLALLMVLLLLALAALTIVLWQQGRASDLRAREAAQTAARLETILSTSLDAIVVSDTSGVILDFNGAAQRTFGYTSAEAIGKRIEEILIPDHLIEAHRSGMARWRAGGEAKVVGRGTVELQARRRSGRVFPVELSIQLARSAGHEILISFIRDISARDAAQRALVEARDRAIAGEKAKADFVAVMSHEIRTPLNGILGALALMRDVRSEREREQLMEAMDASGRILLDHVNDVLDISRMDAGRMSLAPKPTDLPALLREVVSSQEAVAEKQGDRIGWAWIGERPPPLLLDAERLRQVLVNLVGNAVKFTEEGEITLEGEILGQGETARIELRVTDTGIGISEADLPLIFEDFETLDRSRARWRAGTGLGLGIARRIVDAMDGEIEAVSELGEGSQFIVTLPCRPAAAAPEPDAAPAAAIHPAAGLHVLVIEDNAINRLVLRGMLSRRGCTVEEAEDGFIGVDMAAHRRFDLILVDIGMPRMDGFEAARRIRAGGASAEAPIHAVTADALARQGKGFAGSGVQSVLTKPLAPADLDAVLAEIVSAEASAVGAGAARHAAAGPQDLNLDQLAQMRAELGAPVLRELVARLLAEAETELPAVIADLDVDPTAAAARAHRLAGAAAGFGADALHAELRGLEIAVRHEDVAAARAHAAAAERLWPRLRDALRETA